MDIIVLSGKTNSGKTSSLKYLMMKILDMNGIKPLYSSQFFSIDPKELKENIKNNWRTANYIRNLSIIVEYNKKVICITSYGDSLEDIKRALDRAINRYGKCDVFVCGRHKRNDPKMEFSEYHPKNIVTIEKARSLVSKEFDKDNVAKGEELFESLISFLI